MVAPGWRDDRISGTAGEDVETTGKSEREPMDEGAVRSDNMDAVSLDPTAEATDAEDVERCEAASCVADSDGDEDAAGAEEVDAANETDSTDGDPESDEPVAPGGLAKLRGMAWFSLDSDRLRAAWRAHSLARTASLSIFICALVVGSGFFFVMHPLSTRLHEVREQKSMLHDYVVIQQADAAIGAFRSGLMTGDQRLTVMSEVRLMAEGSGVKIAGDPDLLLKRDISGYFAEYPVRLRVKGSFHGVGEFLSLLESSPRFVLVEEIEMMSDVASKSSKSEATVILALAAWEG